MIAFISGHTDSPEVLEPEFQEHYVPKLDKAIENNDCFVTAAAYGIDRLAIQYLLDNGVSPSQISIYLHEKYADRKAEYQAKGFVVKGPFASHSDRDAQMTKDSDYDIAWVRSDDEAKAIYGDEWKKGDICATEKNIRRRILIYNKQEQ